MCSPLIIQLTRKLPFGSTLVEACRDGVWGGRRVEDNIQQDYLHRQPRGPPRSGRSGFVYIVEGV